MIYWIKNINLGCGCVVHFDVCEKIIEDLNAIEFINLWCLEHGSTYDGRRAAVKFHLHIHQKVPILINESYKDILFPTSDLRYEKCLWINYRGVNSVKGNHKHTMIRFHNGSSMIVDCDARIIRTQLKRCREYLEIIK